MCVGRECEVMHARKLFSCEPLDTCLGVEILYKCGNYMLLQSSHTFFPVPYNVHVLCAWEESLGVCVKLCEVEQTN